MNIKIARMSTFPSRKNEYWQFVFLPTFSVFGNTYDVKDKHASVNFEWLFWMVSFVIVKQSNEKEYNFS